MSSALFHSIITLHCLLALTGLALDPATCRADAVQIQCSYSVDAVQKMQRTWSQCGEMLADNDTEREIGDLIFRSISTRGGPHGPLYTTNFRLR